MEKHLLTLSLWNLRAISTKDQVHFFGPPMGKKIIFFIDDMNLPYVETYGTQNAIALLTQHMQHQSIFDRADLGMRKDLVDIQYVAAMNPTAGSFEVCERCQRYFAIFFP